MYVFDELEECLMLYSTEIEFLKSYVAKYMYVSRNSTQIMTDHEDNRQICLPREIQDRLPKSFY